MTHQSHAWILELLHLDLHRYVGLCMSECCCHLVADTPWLQRSQCAILNSQIIIFHRHWIRSGIVQASAESLFFNKWQTPSSTIMAFLGSRHHLKMSWLTYLITYIHPCKLERCKNTTVKLQYIQNSHALSNVTALHGAICNCFHNISNPGNQQDSCVCLTMVSWNSDLTLTNKTPRRTELRF